MAGILGHWIGPHKKHAVPRQASDLDKILELQSAKEILAEVFGVDIEKKELWPAEFSMGCKSQKRAPEIPRLRGLYASRSRAWLVPARFL